MRQQALQQQRWPLKRTRPHHYGGVKEQAEEGSENGGDPQPLSLEQHAGHVARQIIRSSNVDDTTEHWRALKRAFLAGHEFARRT